MNTILNQWDSYKSDVLPKNAPPIQIKECRMAFYAGAKSLLDCLLDVALTDLSDEASAIFLEGYELELDEFAKQLLINHYS